MRNCVGIAEVTHTTEGPLAFGRAFLGQTYHLIQRLMPEVEAELQSQPANYVTSLWLSFHIGKRSGKCLPPGSYED